MMSASCVTEIASMRAAVGEKIVGRQLECGRTAFQLYIYDDFRQLIFQSDTDYYKHTMNLTTLYQN